MKTSTLSRSTKPLKRSPLRTKQDAAKLTVKPMNRSAIRIKSRGPKMTPIRRSARGEECLANLRGVCNFMPETTVLCHSNKLADGKGLGLKAPDTRAAYCCSSCHDVIDKRRPLPAWLTWEEVETAFEAAIEKTQAKLRQKKLIA